MATIIKPEHLEAASGMALRGYAVRKSSRWAERESTTASVRVKMKVKRGQDIEWVRAVRTRFPDLRLMVDANGDYSLSDIDHLRRLDDVAAVIAARLRKSRRSPWIRIVTAGIRARNVRS